MVADKIGYPDQWRDYSKLDVIRGDAMGNFWRAVDFENKRELAKIGKPVDRGEWITTPATVNAFYNPSMNDINFPAGNSAGAVLRSELQRCRELRAHRRHCRPRTHAWLRR